MARRSWLVAATGAGALALWRRRGGRRREHVELYFADGSMISLAEQDERAGRLIPLAHRVLAEAR
jgi:hypothetical protein